MSNMKTIGKKLAQINMKAAFDRTVDLGGIARFKCKQHKELPAMTRKQARKHYAQYM